MEENKKPLTDEELEGVSGGEAIYDSQGRYIGEYTCKYGPLSDKFWTSENTWGVYYNACSKCGKPMHQGTMNVFYCDPCDRWEFSPGVRMFNGTADEFLAWARSR